MKDILETTLLEYDKSVFLIDLVKHTRGAVYVEITQTIHERNTESQTIKINPSILSDIIKVLQDYQAKISIKRDPINNYLNDEDQQKIQDRYLKDVSIKDLTIQFDKPEESIEMILRNKGISIVSNKIPKTRFWKKRKKKG